MTRSDGTEAGVADPPRSRPHRPVQGGRGAPGALRSRAWQPSWTPYLFLLPAVLLELLVHFGPMVAGVVMSLLKLTQYQLAQWWHAPFSGLGNYRIVLDPGQPVGASLVGSFVTTAAFTVVVVSVAWFFGMAAAASLQRMGTGRGTLRTLFLVPYAVPVFAAVITWRFLLQRDNGMLNHVLVDQLGLLDGNAFYLIGSNSFWSLCAVEIWREWPFAFLMIMAGLQSIPDDVYEAASIDGAGPWRQLSSITLPLLAPVNQVLVLMMTLRTFRNFETPYVLFGGTAPEPARLISVEIYQNSFVTFNFGLGSAMSVLLLLFLLLLTGGYLALTGKRSDAV